MEKRLASPLHSVRWSNWEAVPFRCYSNWEAMRWTASKINFKETDLKSIKEDRSLNLTNIARNSLSFNGEFTIWKNLFPIPSSHLKKKREREKGK